MIVPPWVWSNVFLAAEAAIYGRDQKMIRPSILSVVDPFGLDDSVTILCFQFLFHPFTSLLYCLSSPHPRRGWGCLTFAARESAKDALSREH